MIRDRSPGVPRASTARRYLILLRFCVLLVAFGAVALTAAAEVEVTTPDGRKVLLRDDHTWEYRPEHNVPDEAKAVLSVTRRVKMSNGCMFGVTLRNELGYTIVSIVPQFSAYARDDVLFETVFQEFRGVRPGRKQYREIKFSGLPCADLRRIKVHGGDRCNMGNLDKFSPVTGACLQRIRVEGGTIVDISK